MRYGMVDVKNSESIQHETFIISNFDLNGDFYVTRIVLEHFKNIYFAFFNSGYVIFSVEETSTGLIYCTWDNSICSWHRKLTYLS